MEAKEEIGAGSSKGVPFPSSLLLSLLTELEEDDFSSMNERVSITDITEQSIKSDATEKAIHNRFYNPRNSLSSELEAPLPSPTASPYGFEVDELNTNISGYYSTNGFPPYSSTWQTTTVDPLEITGNDSDVATAHHHEVGGTTPMPPNFTEISQLNKDCIVAYVILFIFAAVGNILVLYCVSRYDRLGKSRTPLLIMNLCIADLIVTFFLMPTEVIWRFTIAWKGGDLLCKLSQFVRAFGMYLSSNVVICISVDRYFAIVYPLKLAGAVKRVKWMLVGAWIVSAVFAGPQMFVYHVASHPVYPEFRQCVTKAFLTTGPYNELIYNVSSVSALYFIPLIVIIYTYTMILCKIHQKSREHRVANSQQETGSDHSHQSNRTSPNHLNIPDRRSSEMIGFRQPENANSFSRSPSKRARLMLRSSANQTATLTRARSRTLRLTLLILLTFIFCWTPYVVMTLWYMLDRRGASQVDERLQETLFIMAVTNSVLNPLIYGTVGRKQDFKKRLNALVRSSSWMHRLVKHACCCGFVYEHCCETTDGRNSETVVITLNRTNGGSSRRSRLSRGHGQTSPCPHRTPPSPIPGRAAVISRRSQIVTLRSTWRGSNNRGIISRLITSLTKNSRNYQQGETIQELSSNGGSNMHECTECGSVVATQYIFPREQSFASQNCTQL